MASYKSGIWVSPKAFLPLQIREGRLTKGW